MAFGVIDTKYVDLPPGIDGDYIRSLQTRSGIEMADLVRLVDAAMADLNTGVDPLVAVLTAAPTVNPAAGRRRTTIKRAQRGGEYTMARPQRGASAAHMLPITDLEIALGFTEKGLNKISRESFTEELDDMVVAIRQLYLVDTLVRLFDGAEVPVDDDTDVMSPGFAGSGTGTNVFKGVFPDGTVTPNGYTHYGVATAATMATAIKTYRDKIKRWLPEPYDAIPSSAMFDAMVADTANFVPAGSVLIRQGADTAEAQVDPSIYAGVYAKNIRVRQPVLGLGTTKHLAIVKSYGDFDSRNPLAWRYDELLGRDAYVRSRESYPLVNAQVMQSYGIGVNNRVGAALLMIDEAAGAYAAPTIDY